MNESRRVAKRHQGTSSKRGLHRLRMDASPIKGLQDAPATNQLEQRAMIANTRNFERDYAANQLKTGPTQAQIGRVSLRKSIA